MNSGQRNIIGRGIVGASAFIVFLCGLYITLKPFFSAGAWALILVLTLWPLHRRLLRLMPRSPQTAAFFSTFLLVLVVFVILFPLVAVLIAESTQAVRNIDHWLTENHSSLQEIFSAVPVVGEYLAEEAHSLQAENQKLLQVLLEYRAHLLKAIAAAAKSITGFLFQLFFCFMLTFFLFHHGPAAGRQINQTMEMLTGENAKRIIFTIRLTVRGVVYGVLATAAAQGILAGIGYFVCGVPMPLLLGFVTFCFSLIPFGTPFIYLPAALYLILVQESWFWGLLLGAWGVGVISMADNLLRPMFISQTTAMPFVLVFIGVVGGALGFGLLGVFLGPVILAVAHVLWREGLLAKQPN